MEYGTRADQALRKASGSLYPYVSVIPVLLLIAVIAALHIFLSETPFARRQINPPLLLPILNTVFIFLTAIIVSCISLRSYLLSGSLPLLLLGMGVLTFGSGALAAGWLRTGSDGINVSMTIINVSFLISSIFHTAGMVFSLSERKPQADPGRRRLMSEAAYLGVLVLVALITAASLAGAMPVFFAPETGTTPLRQAVIAAAFILFSSSSLSMMMHYGENRMPFLYWYALALASLAVAMIGLFFLKTFETPIVWAGRIAQYLAGIYFLSAVFSAFRDARARGATLDQVVAELFQAPGAYWHNVLSTVSDAVVSYDARGRIVQWNQAAETIFGYSRSEAMGTCIGLIMGGPDGTEDFRAQKGSISEMKLKRKDASLFDAEVSTSKTNLSTEITTHVIRDITERRKAEDLLRLHRNHLEELVRERTTELEKSNRQLRQEIAERKQAEEDKENLESQLIQTQKLDALGRFAGGIAHDLNNILYPIMVNTETLLEEAQEGTDQYEILKQTLDAACRQRDLVKQILSFSRQETRKLQPVSVAPLVEETLSFLRSTLPSSIELKRAFKVPSDTVMGDPTQIQQVIMNLCRNAADALEVDRGTIEVILDTANLDLDPTQPDISTGEYIELKVTDTGHGIPPEVMDRIFEPFFTTKRAGKGNGMGLSVVHGILKKHGGCIKVESRQGEGSCFSVYLPLHKTLEN